MIFDEEQRPCTSGQWSWFEKLVTIDMRYANNDFYRADGHCVCAVCGRMFLQHPQAFIGLSLLCNGDLVHL